MLTPKSLGLASLDGVSSDLDKLADILASVVEFASTIDREALVEMERRQASERKRRALAAAIALVDRCRRDSDHDHLERGRG